MKNAILMSVVALGLVACASQKSESQAVPPAKPAHACGVRAPQPAPAPAPKQACNACSKSYTVSEPVEVVYKNVTYTTVYEPKTYSNTTYVKKPYSCQEGGLCGQNHPAPAPIIVNE